MNCFRKRSGRRRPAFSVASDSVLLETKFGCAIKNQTCSEMRLLNVHTVEFEEFFDESCPRYAILSHTWGREETSFQAFSSRSFDPGLATAIWKGATQGIMKVIEFCQLIRKVSRYEWVWIDTCCINKESSAELSEAINSMFKWYSDAWVCCAYLSDVELTDENRPRGGDISKSRWFTRGWTLQELLAPRKVEFYDRNWEFIGNGRNLLDEIHKGSGISKEALYSILHSPTHSVLEKFPVATKMSWAANRQTRRKEDAAYSLLGLFGINMSLLYGEGDKAFIRLQKKIIKSCNDETIFAWNLPDIAKDHGLLAQSPSYFRGSTQLEPHLFKPQPSSLTNQGIQFQVRCHFPANRRKGLWQGESVILPLNCGRSGDVYSRIGIHLTYNSTEWLRRASCALVDLKTSYFLPILKSADADWLPLFVELDCKGRSPVIEKDGNRKSLGFRYNTPGQLVRFNDQELDERSLVTSFSMKSLESIYKEHIGPESLIDLGYPKLSLIRSLSSSVDNTTAFQFYEDCD